MKNLMTSSRIKNQKHPLARQPNVAKALTSSFVMALVLMGCRSKLDVETKSGAPLTESKEDPNAVVTQGGKFHFQIRDTIKISLSKAFIDGAETLDIYNVTGVSPENEADAPLVIKDYAIPQNMLAGDQWPEGQGFQMAPKGDAVVLNIFPQDSDARRNLLPGKNRLKISVDDEINPRYTYIDITIHRLGNFEFSQMAFQGKSQRAQAVNSKGSYLEGWMNTVSPHRVKDSTGQTTLTVGFYNMMHSF